MSAVESFTDSLGVPRLSVDVLAETSLGVLMDEHEALKILHRMASAINSHDLETLVSGFHPDYVSVQPAHPERSFQGRERVAENWGWVFDRFDDFQAEVIDYSVRDGTVWSEWVWRGTNSDESLVEVRGIMILTMEDGLIRAGRLYMEPMSS